MSEGVLRWRVRREFLVLKIVATLVLATVTVLTLGDLRGALLAGAATVAAPYWPCVTSSLLYGSAPTRRGSWW